MKQDDGIRTKNGIVCCLRKNNNEELTLIFDDVSNEKQGTSGTWKHNVVFTWKDIKAKDIENLPETELAEIGSNLIIRLLALQDK